MGRLGRPGLSDEQKRELWRRWKDGESLSEIGRALGKHAASIHGVVRSSGGIVPRTRHRSMRSLTLEEREEISRGIAADQSIREIAASIGRSPSTVCREISRNGGRRLYRASDADSNAWERARRPKLCRLATNRRLQRIVARKLSEDWSPEQISGWLRVAYSNEDAMQISHETIYRSLFVQARGVLKKELLRHLRTRRVNRRSKKSRTKGQPRGQIIDGVSIRERPAEVEDRAIPGHWEGDLVSGAGNSHVATLVERHSRFTMLVKLEGKDTTTVVRALSRHAKKIPAELRRSITWDRGTEMAAHKDFTLATNIQVYFCDPQSPWQRGTNENTNRLIRQYLPKGSDLAVHSQAALNKIARRLNQRPRKTLDYQTPADRLRAVVASIG